jgi:hypothetical protein
VEETEKRIERVLGPYIRAHGRGSDPKRELRALRVEFGEELTPETITRPLRVVHKHIELDESGVSLPVRPKN